MPPGPHEHRHWDRTLGLWSRASQRPRGQIAGGCLSLQYRKPKEKSGAYYQLSYTYQMKSKTEYVPAELVPQIEQELAEYKRYRELTAEWVDLSIALSRLKMTQWKQTRTSN